MLHEYARAIITGLKFGLPGENNSRVLGPIIARKKFIFLSYLVTFVCHERVVAHSIIGSSSVFSSNGPSWP